MVRLYICIYIYIEENDFIHVEMSINFGVLIALIGYFHLLMVDFTFSMLTSLNCRSKFFVVFRMFCLMILQATNSNQSIKRNSIFCPDCEGNGQ